MAAFASMAVQVDGLIGSHGILPVADYLDRASRELGPGAGDLLASADVALARRVRSCPARALLGRLACCGACSSPGSCPGLCAVLLWLSYLSIVGGRPGLSGLSVGFSAPGGGPAGGAHGTLAVSGWVAPPIEPWWFTIWLVRWLVFRLMFMSGVVKLTSHDPTWWDLTALDFHYETQPLPAWTSWYVHQMPAWFHRLSVGFMFYAELVAPFFIFGPRRSGGWVSRAWCSCSS